jgi:tRNA uridine 5-carboxymethylaminomethyl modification enzyme
LDKAPLYNGVIEGEGPRYCPSIEVKVVRFAEKERHQLFIEPEGRNTDEVYIQGLSTSLPYDVQNEIVHSIAGLENAKIMRYAYAIEYDCIDPLCLTPSLEIKGVKGLFSAGQINGSSGYEEAAAQGLIAGINAVQYVRGKEPFVLGRGEAYIGVLIDDLVTKGTNEPYRMMTGRAEYRIYLRQDNADLRLTEKGRALGLVSDERYAAFTKRQEEIEEIRRTMNVVLKADGRLADMLSAIGESATSSVKLCDLIKRPRVDRRLVSAHYDVFDGFDVHNVDYVVNELKYEGYLKKERAEIERMKKLDDVLIPDVDFETIKGLRLEARQKLNKIKPKTLGQASRISGVSPADVTVLLLMLKKEC